MQRANDPGDLLARRAVMECLARSDRALQPLEVARQAHLSTLVVVPALAGLVEDALVTRDQRARGSRHGATWTYRLTARGSRSLAVAMRPTG